MPAPDPRPLRGLCVLVTRPREQAGRLARLIEQAGGDAFLFPTLEIVAPDDPDALRGLIDRIGEFNLALFISANAVTHGFAAVLARFPVWPAHLAVGAVGQATADALRERGVTALLAPAERFDSEALLELPALQDVRGKRVVIFRGQDGREHLAETLQARGARVEYARCYRRRRPQSDATGLRQALARGDIHAVTLTSVDAVRHLHDMLGAETRHLRSLPAVVVSPRVAQACDEAGSGMTPVLARVASDEAIVDALKAWRGAQKNL